jgi:hypothetical protein
MYHVHLYERYNHFLSSVDLYTFVALALVLCTFLHILSFGLGCHV